jgi:hypothetical protein
MDTEKQLIEETIKWKARIEEELAKAEPKSERGKEFLSNISAYVKDSGSFMEKKDFVRAFEAVIWAWAIFETGKQAGFID